MLVPSMNNNEVTAEILKDYQKVIKTSLPRLLEQYDRERKKLKIDKTRSFFREYSIRSAAKNNWLFFIHKNPSVPKYKDQWDTVGGGVVYYYSSQGLRVFRPHDNHIEVFNGHLFTRYNERMGLNIHHQLDVIKHFFHNAGYMTTYRPAEEQKASMKSVCKHGTVLGTYQDGATPWYVHNTFISHDIQRNDQIEFERQALRSMQIELAIVRANPILQKNTTAYMNTANTVQGIMGLRA